MTINQSSSSSSTNEPRQLVRLPSLSRRDSSKREYVVIDSSSQMMGTTTDAKSASSPETLYNFVIKNINALRMRQLQFLSCYQLQNVDPYLISVRAITNQKLDEKSASAKKVSFAKDAEVKAVFRNASGSIKFSMPAEPRDKQDQNRVMQIIQNPQHSLISIPLGSKIDFHYLLENNLDGVEYFLTAAANKLIQITTSKTINIFPPTAHEGVSYICGQLSIILQAISELNVSEIEAALIEKVISNNEKIEMIDRATFHALVAGGRKTPRDLFNAPEYRLALKAYQKNAWAEDEEKKITFTQIGTEVMDQFRTAVKILFTDEDVIPLLKRLKKHQK